MTMQMPHRFAQKSTAFAAAALLLGSAPCLTGCSDSDTGASTEVSSAPSPDISLDAALIAGDDNAVRDHIIAGTQVNTKNMTGDTPLHIAAALGRTYAADLLIDAGAELETKNGSGVTPLFNAAFFCHTDVLESLLEAGANPNATDQNGSSILQIIEMPWDQIRPIYEMVHTSIGLPFDEQRIESARPDIAAMLR